LGPRGTLALEQVLALDRCTASFRDVSEAPDAPDLACTDDLDRGVALEDAAVLEFQDIEALGRRLGIDRAYTCDKGRDPSTAPH
jgi:hypothetical protein